ncbi:phosphate/phosphite/phosphonate ABC transporter substrate-binding protein [Pseudonocardia pini]|uniref:phosphate/phosphite/phosphonate ABC transporter substrate-binding protein n=1 Tax=Pseudonocardia pini TaxID=2758030 RepID=UPI0015F063D3|nr:phosphate/phosphite/phosphonate ABC transporter substrate-binding protein [Pseudonocardia pini]
MSRTRRAPFLLALATAVLAAAGCATPASSADTAAPATLKMGLPPGEAAPDLVDRFQPVADLIAKGAGRPVEVTKTSDYLAIVEAMRSGLLDVAVFSPFPTPLAEEVANVTPLVVAKGTPYNSVFVCRTDRGIESIEDIRGKKVAFVDPGSTSGNYIPKLLLKRAGIDPETDVQGTYAGGHDSAELAVKQGSVDCAADAGMIYRQMTSKGIIDPNVQRIVAESEPLPVSIVIIARDGLDPAITDGIVRSFTTEPNPEALEVASATSFAAAQESDFELFREAARELGVDLQTVGT